MATGLFVHRSHNQGRSFAVWRARQRKESTIDRLAQCLADGDGDVHACAARLGISYTYGSALFQRMRKRLGGQAV